MLLNFIHNYLKVQTSHIQFFIKFSKKKSLSIKKLHSKPAPIIMECVTILGQYHLFNQSQGFSSFLVHNVFTDCTLIVEGREIYAHRVILAAASPFFMNLFHNNNFGDNGYVISGVRYEDFCNVIKFIYYGYVDLQKSEVQGFHTVATQLDLWGIRDVKVFFRSSGDVPMKSAKCENPKKSGNCAEIKEPRAGKTSEKGHRKVTRERAQKARKSLSFSDDSMEIDFQTV